MFYIINSADYDGRRIDITSVLLESDKTPEEGFDIDAAVSKAVNEYVRTDEGFRILAENDGTLNLDIFNDCIPNEICEKYGFHKVQNVSISSLTKGEDTAFNKKPEFIVTDIQWDTDGEETDLPDSCHIPFDDLTEYGYLTEEYSLESLKDNIANYLSDMYDYCVRGFSVV